jgi:hypothetical protein
VWKFGLFLKSENCSQLDSCGFFYQRTSSPTDVEKDGQRRGLESGECREVGLGRFLIQNTRHHFVFFANCLARRMAEIMLEGLAMP